jgi:N-acetylmuramoyl-L-alanine amidase
MKRIAAAIMSLAMILTFFLPVNAFTIIYDGKTEDYPWDPITMVVDGTVVKTKEMPPISLNGRTLVPAREFFEQLGASVTWVQSKKQVIVEYNGERIVMTIGSRVVFVGDKSVQISSSDPAPKIINDKTMIPVRLVAEAFGFEVEWVNSTREVRLTSPKTSAENVVATSVLLTTEGSTDEILIMTSEYVEPSIFKMQNPERVVIDLYGVKAKVNDGSITTGGATLSKVRYSQHSDKFRVVADMTCVAEATAEKSANGIIIKLKKTGELDETDSSLTDSNEESDDNSSNDIVDLNGKTVVVDAGHGGSDPGAIYPVGSSSPTIREKDVTLAIALKVRDNLKAKGINVIMTRSSDTYPTLQDRVEIANDSGADLFVSIHCNSMTDKDNIDGAQVYYFGSSEFGKQYASIVYNNIVKYTGMTKRGIQDGSTLYVIKNTNMPAILTEGGFVSNANDRAYLLSTEGQSAIAKAIADGVAEALKLL